MQKPVQIKAGPITLEGDLAIPDGASAVVIFAHGSGSSRHSPRNRYVAKVLNEAGIGTLLFDLLTREEDTVYENRFDIELLTNRLKAATTWLINHPQSKGMRIGYFGASTGAAAALMAEPEFNGEIGAVVSRGGRPDMAEKLLGQVQAPTLLIVGGDDDLVIQLNRKAYNLLTGTKELKIIPGATHLFEEPGTLEEAAKSAAEWFVKYL